MSTNSTNTSSYRRWKPNQALKRAAERRKMDLLKTALRAGADINHVSEQSQNTALMVAAQKGHVEIIEYLLEKGANVAVQYTPPLPPLSQDLQIIDMDAFENPEDVPDQVPEIEDVVGSTTIVVSAAVSAAIFGWPDVLKLLVQTHQANVVQECGANSYGGENVLFACAHHAKLRCLHVVLHCAGAEAKWPEALEHASFAPAVLDDTISLSLTDLWWIPNNNNNNNNNSFTSTSPLPSTPLSSSSRPPRRRLSASSSSPSTRTQEISQRQECRDLLLDALISQGRLSECLPYIRHTCNVLVTHAELDPETGEEVATVPLFVGYHVLADILERLGTRASLLEAAHVYGQAYQMSKRLFGKTEVTITALGNWSACIVRIKSDNTPVDLRMEGEPMLRAALKDLKATCDVDLHDSRVVRWQGLLLPLQPGRAPFEPMSYLTAEEINPYYKEPPRNQHSTHWRVDDPIIPYPSDEALHPSFSPFLDELEIVKNILDQLHKTHDELTSEQESTTTNPNGTQHQDEVKPQKLSERGVLMESVKKNWRCIQFAHSKYRKDYGIVMTAVSFHGVALQCVDVTLQDNEKICTAAVTEDWRAFSYATPNMKRKKKLFRLAKQLLIAEMESSTEKTESWRCLEYADPMLRGDVDVVEAALQVSEDAFQFVDRYVYSESVSWKKIWPAFLRRCRRRIMNVLVSVLTVAAVAGLAYVLVYVVFYSLIWPPVLCAQTNITYLQEDDGEIIMNRVVYEQEYPNSHVCNTSLFSPAPAPRAQEVDNDDREAERKELAERMAEEQTKVAAEEKQKERR